jgi:epoxyqueuosine reductase QueG
VKLSPDIIKSIYNGPDIYYFRECNRINNLLDNIVAAGVGYLKKTGFKAYPQTTTTIIQPDDYRTVLPHKTVATRAGLGWIGKCSLLVTKEYGSGIRISSFLTNAKLNCGNPVEKSFCGNCMECVKNCPAGAVYGKLWNIKIDRSELIDVKKCKKTEHSLTKEKIGKEAGLCGKCFAVCPYTMKYTNKTMIEMIEMI